ncbi:MAG: hypothetical protein AAFO74_16050 [Pseudomonadota bacterium]
MVFVRTFLTSLALLGCALSAGAHEWEEMDLMPDIILERLVEIMEAAEEADKFASARPENCVPHHCLEQVLLSADEQDFNWLATAPEAEVPSSLLGRLPANVTHEWLFDLVPLMDHSAPTREQTQLIERLERLLPHWTQP